MCTYPVCNKLSSESVQCGKGESSFATLASRGDSDAVYDVESVQHTAFHHIEYRAQYVHENFAVQIKYTVLDAQPEPFCFL